MKKSCMIAALCAVFLLALSFSTVAYAGGGPETPPPPPVLTPTTEPKPFTPPGTGTVIDNATDEDGKEFYTIKTPDENVFYLVIDKQRGQENVYFLNAVTEKDLLALAEKSKDKSAAPEPPATPSPTPAPTTEPTPTPEPAPEKSGNGGMVVLLVVILLGGGAAGWYFKIYRPKQGQTSPADEYEPEEDYGDYEVDSGEDAGDDSPPWDEDDTAGEDAE